MEKTPTRVRVYYADSLMGLNICAQLCQLGYTVVVDRYYQDHKILSKFHHIKIDVNGSEDYDYVFDPNEIQIVVSRRRSSLFHEYIKTPEVEIPEFVGFVIYHWGLVRGGRPLYESPITVDQKKIQDWALEPLITI